jgi:hypothetical protein
MADSGFLFEAAAMIGQICGPEYTSKALLTEPATIPDNVLIPGRGL